MAAIDDRVKEGMEYIAKRFGDPFERLVVIEVVTSALKAIQDYPELTMIEAIETGCKEYGV